MDRRQARLWIVCRVIAALGILTVAPISARADDTADGRRRAQRASALAAKGKCRQAINEYDKAIAVLRDPALLFNRGECHRKLGNTESALEDYKQFLSDLPTAPNRAQVESRIAELKKKSGATSSSAAAVAPPAASSASTAGAGASAKSDSRAASGESAGARAPAPVSVGGPTSDPIRPSATASATAESAGGGSPILLSNQDAAPPASPSETSGDSLARRPWFWIAVGAVVVGAGIGAYFVLGHDATSIPPSDLGNYKF